MNGVRTITDLYLVLTRPSNIRIFLKLCRVKQWLKNSFVFAALLFSGQFFIPEKLLLTTFAFLAFSFVSSSVYVLNDIIDCEKDKLHPQKKDRPIAAGIINVSTAVIYGSLLLGAGLFLGWKLNLFFLYILVFYIVINIIYSIWLKNVVFIDIFIIAFGFVLRVLAGTLVLAVAPSPWLILCTFLLALFLGLCKRRAELITLKQDSITHRQILSEYNHHNLLDQLIGMTISTTIVAYSLYTFYSPIGIKMMYTIPFVIFTIFRYLLLVYQKAEGGEPANLFFNDRILMFSFILWVGVTFWLIYFNQTSYFSKLL